jgi:hypothetical protein
MLCKSVPPSLRRLHREEANTVINRYQRAYIIYFVFDSREWIVPEQADSVVIVNPAKFWIRHVQQWRSRTKKFKLSRRYWKIM